MTSPLMNVIELINFDAAQEDACRLFHGRGFMHGEALQHVSVDWLPPIVLITLFAPESKQGLEEFSASFMEHLPACESVQVQYRYEKLGPFELMVGKAIDSLVVLENQCKYSIALGKARNTGLFLDMREGRQWVAEHSKGKRVLNLFAYTCGFSVAAKAGGAKSVVNIDMSSPSLSVGRDNHRLNEHEMRDIQFEKLNIFKSFGRINRRGPFDLLVCDPPTFQKGSVDIVRDYPKVLRRLPNFMAEGADLLLCLNAPNLGREYLLEAVTEHAPQYEYVEDIAPPEIFADAKGDGLKVMHFRAKGNS